MFSLPLLAISLSLQLLTSCPVHGSAVEREPLQGFTLEIGDLDDGGANDRPIVAIMSQELSFSLVEIYGNNTYSSYIPASYVKFVEAAGARVVPVMIDQPDEYYERIFRMTNGLLIPGGSTSIYDSGYSRGVQILLRLALDSFDQRLDPYPIWGTCLGFELLAYLTNGGVANLTPCISYDVALKLNLTQGFDSSRISEKMPADITQILATEDVTANFHHKCLATDSFDQPSNALLRDFWTPLATGVDNIGLEFVALMESKQYPVWGSQFHPEKNAYEWTTRLSGIPHFRDAIRSAQFFADFFVGECRKSSHRLANCNEEMLHLIYNYSPKYTGHIGTMKLEQCYLFE